LLFEEGAVADLANPNFGYVRLRDASGRRFDSLLRTVDQGGTSPMAVGNFRLFERGRWSGRMTDNLQERLMQAAQVAVNLIQDAVTGVGTPIDVRGISPITLYVRGNGAVSAGSVQLETAHDKEYTGNWAVIGAPVIVPGNGEAIFHTHEALAAIRVRVAANVVGGTATVFCVGGVVA
jgi:hypothetical protein